MLSAKSRMDNEDSWKFDLLEASENDFPPEVDKEFEIPPGMEAFAEKIGLEWDLSVKPALTQEVSRSPSPSPVFQNYPLPQTVQEEDVWGDFMATLNPMVAEGRQVTEPMAAMGQTVTTGITINNTPPSPSPAFQNYPLQTGKVEEGWGNLMVSVSPMEVEGRQFTKQMMAMGQTVATSITINETSPSPSRVLQDDPLPQTGQEEEVWGDLMVSVSPMVVEGRQFPEPMGQTVTAGITINDNNNQGKMNQVILLTDQEMENIRINEKIPQFTEADYEDLDSIMNDSLEALLHGTEPIAVNDGQKFDMVKYAIGEAGLGLDEDVDQTEEVPTKTTRDIDEDYVPDFKKIKAAPEDIVEMKPVENVSIEVIEETPRKRKRRAGRPSKTAPITVTVIPDDCKLSDAELNALKYQRNRELNNMASRRFRQKRKQEEEQKQQELEQLKARHHQLQETADRMEREFVLLKAIVSKLNQ